jgi:hypothetical protein
MYHSPANIRRGGHPALKIRIAHSLAEEIGIAAELLRRCERDRIDQVLDYDIAVSREAGDGRARDLTNSRSAAAGNARLIQPLS